MKVKRFVATGLFFFCLAAMVPFSISAILMLLDFYDLGRAACIFGSAAFALFLSLTAWHWSEREQDAA
jgi:hypothetical protein